MTLQITRQQAIETLFGSDLANAYDVACRQWVAAVPQMAAELDPNTRPVLVPATVVPYGHNFLGWIREPGTPSAVIQVPTGHRWRAINWEGGRITLLGNVMGLLRHELAHHVQFFCMVRDGDVCIDKNSHYSSHWLRTIAIWHGMADPEGWVKRGIRALACPEPAYVRGCLAGYDFDHNSLRLLTEAMEEAERATIEANTVTCAHCGTEFVRQRSTKRTCSAACRVALSRAKARSDTSDDSSSAPAVTEDKLAA